MRFQIIQHAEGGFGVRRKRFLGSWKYFAKGNHWWGRGEGSILSLKEATLIYGMNNPKPLKVITDPSKLIEE